MCCPEYGSCSKLKDLSDSDITKATSLADLAATKYVKVWPGAGGGKLSHRRWWWMGHQADTDIAVTSQAHR